MIVKLRIMPYNITFWEKQFSVVLIIQFLYTGSNIRFARLFFLKSYQSVHAENQILQHIMLVYVSNDVDIFLLSYF